jgi:hypothetical protein
MAAAARRVVHMRDGRVERDEPGAGAAPVTAAR